MGLVFFFGLIFIFIHSIVRHRSNFDVVSALILCIIVCIVIIYFIMKGLSFRCMVQDDRVIIKSFSHQEMFLFSDIKCVKTRKTYRQHQFRQFTVETWTIHLPSKQIKLTVGSLTNMDLFFKQLERHQVHIAADIPA